MGGDCHVAKWTGMQWLALGGSFGLDIPSALHIFDDGAGARLYALGNFRYIDGVEMDGFARWNGSAWERSPGNGGIGSVYGVASYNDGNGMALFVSRYVGVVGGGGNFPGVGRFAGYTWLNIGGPGLGP